jgi:hypothetical protein
MPKSTRKRIEEALVKRALGFTYEETRTESTDKGEKVVVTERYSEPEVR